MKKKLLAFIVLIICLGLFLSPLFHRESTISWDQYVNEAVPKQHNEFALDFFDTLHHKQFDKASKKIDENYISPDNTRVLQQLGDVLNYDSAKYKVINFHIFQSQDLKRSTLTYEVNFDNNWLMLTAVVDDKLGEKKIAGFSFAPVGEPINDFHSFRLSYKGFMHILMLVASICIGIFVTYAAVTCAKSDFKRKWLWIPFILTGFTKLSLQWTSGEWFFQLISINIPVTAFLKGSPYSPWIISIGIPIGALMFMLKNRQYKHLDNKEVKLKTEEENMVMENSIT